ncbi:MAG: hypothetical protein AAB594_03300, partial [Patescibacteria group bacterium]
NYRWYSNLNSLTPTSPLASENVSIDVPSAGSIIRLRMNLSAGIDFGTGLTFKLQFSNSTSSGFADVGTSTGWIFSDNAGVADGQIIVTTVLSGSNVGESYGESNPSAATPNGILTGEKGEWDWVVSNNSADTGLNWYFRMIFSSSTVLDAYDQYPTLTAVSPSTPGGGGNPTVILSGGGGGLALTSTEPISPKIESPCDSIIIQQVDFSGDCRVDIVDLSILLYYYEQTGPKISRFDLNDNNAVDFPDVSIMMFYWTY